MSSKRLAQAAVSLLGAASLLAPAPANADGHEVVCGQCVPDRSGAEPFEKIGGTLRRLEVLFQKDQPGPDPFEKIDYALSAVMDKH